MKNASLTSTYDPTYLAYGTPTPDGIIPIFPPGSAIPAASGESNALRWALRHSAAILRGGFSLEPTIPRISIAFVAIVAITMMGIAIVPFPAPPYTKRVAESRVDSTGRQIAAKWTVNAPVPARVMCLYRQVRECARCHSRLHQR